MGVRPSFVRGGTSGVDTKPLKDGQILFDKERKRILFDAYVGGTLTRIVMTEQDTFIGNAAVWAALTDAQKANYTFVYILDDYDDNPITVMTGATSSADGAEGLVPQPHAGDQGKALLGNGTWGVLPNPTWAVSGETATFSK